MILCPHNTPNNARADFHSIRRIEVSPPFNTAMLTVASYADEATFINSGMPMWSTPLPLPVESVDGNLLAYAEAYLVSHPESPFFGGTIVSDASITLPAAKQRGIDRINRERDRRIDMFSEFTFDGVVYDGYTSARENITEAADGARVYQVFPDDWTWRAKDNTDIPMDSVKILELEAAMIVARNLYKGEMHMIARYLKGVIDADETNTQEMIDAVVWPLQSIANVVEPVEPA